MSRRRIHLFSLALVASLLLIGLGVLFVVLGLDSADKLGSILGAFSGLIGVAIAGISLTQARTMQREAVAASSEELRTLVRAIRPAAPLPVQAKSSLPTDVPDFVNREEELAQVESAAGNAAPSIAAVCAINGMAGIGKTALAVRAAHRLADAYPDGRLFLNLHAHSPDRDHVAPEKALEALLRALGLAADQIPESLDERIALWRSETAGSRILTLFRVFEFERGVLGCGPGLVTEGDGLGVKIGV